MTARDLSEFHGCRHTGKQVLSATLKNEALRSFPAGQYLPHWRIAQRLGQEVVRVFKDADAGPGDAEEGGDMRERMETTTAKLIQAAFLKIVMVIEPRTAN